MVIYLAGLQDVPRELYEAADIDGASGWQRLRNVTLPMISPVIFFNLIMAIIGSLQIFATPYIMTGGGPARATYFYTMYLYDNALRLPADGLRQRHGLDSAADRPGADGAGVLDEQTLGALPGEVDMTTQQTTPADAIPARHPHGRLRMRRARLSRLLGQQLLARPQVLMPCDCCW